MKSDLKKQYKADTPQGTVRRIKDIIANHHLPVTEHILGDGKNFCSCRISLSRDSDETIGTNGKGMNIDYAMASGYAEFMERLQNRVLVYPNPASIGGSCLFFPDEKAYSWNKNEAEREIKRFTPRTWPDGGFAANRLEGKALPFYHVNSGKCVDVPYSLIRWVNGSNGMASGNIAEEALIQGFCEIFERYCIQQMYIRKIVPPNVPLSVFKDTEVLTRLQQLTDAYGMEWSVKDYSLGEGFPVLGLLLYNPDKSKYILHLGADLDPRIALERCYTEIFQGYTPESLTFENDVNACERLDTFNEFKRSLMYGRGRQDESFFCDAPTYEYAGHTTIPSGRDFKEDLHNICRWLMDKNYDIYIRDNSFLGFPALHIVVPGMSEIDKEFCNLNRRVTHMQLTENQMNPLFHLSWLTDDGYADTIEYLDQMLQDTVELFPRNSNPGNSLNRQLLLMILNIRLKRFESAAAHLEEYIKHCHKKGIVPRPYYPAMLNIIKGRASGNESGRDYKIAHTFLSRPEKAIDAIETPDCFNCPTCPLAKGCRFPLMSEIEDIVQQAMANRLPDQNALSDIFKCL